MTYRKGQYGQTTTGILISKRATPRDAKGNVYYWIKVEFQDRKKEITLRYTLLFLNQWLLQDDYIPNELVNIIVDYLGDSYFYYGPFRITFKVNETYYRECDEIANIPIRYDPKYPHDAEALTDISSCQIGRSCSFLIIALCLMYLIVLLFRKYFPFDNEWNGSNGTLLIIIGVSLIFNCSWFWCFVRGEKVKWINKLQIESAEINV